MECESRPVPDLFSDYSRPAAETAGLERYVVRSLALRRGFEGPQVVAAWEAPPDPARVERIRLVRRFLAFPEGPDDGMVLAEAPPAAGRFTDLDLPGCDCAYYTVFSLRADTGEWVTLPRARGSIIPVATGSFGRRLMALLPELYLIADKKLERGGTGKVALERRQDPARGDWFNLNQDGRTPKGQLARFLKIFGGELDLAKGLIDCLPRQFDVDETCAQNLPLLAALVGLELNRELSIPQQREEIKRQVEVYRLKGTAAAIGAKARSITGFPVGVDDWCDNILVANREDRRVADLAAPWRSRAGLPSDPTSYVIDGSAGGLFRWGRFGVFFQIPCGECLPRWVVEKLARILPRYTAACAEARPIFLDCRYEETYDRDRMQEAHRAVLTERPRVERLYDLCWLYANDEERRTNSRFRSAAAGVACADAWWDHVEIEDEVHLEDARRLRWLLANDPHRRSNSRFRTATPVDYALDAWADRFDRRADLEPVDGRGRWLLANRLDRLTNRLHLSAFRGPAAELWADAPARVPAGGAVRAFDTWITRDVEAVPPALGWLRANDPGRTANSRYTAGGGPLAIDHGRDD
jgi:phage tail-like protein